jgi:putative permease
MLHKFFFWSFLFLIIGFFLFSITNIIAPFLISIIFAYLLRPFISYISKKCHISENIATIIVYILFISIFIAAIIFILPIIYSQILHIIEKIPLYKDYIQFKLLPLLAIKISELDPSIASSIKDILKNLSNNMFAIVNSIVNNFWRGALSTINKFMLFILVPVLLYHFLQNWKKIISSLDDLIPLKNKDKIDQVVLDIDKLLSAYIRGQLNVCLLLSCFYSTSFLFLGNESWLLLGMMYGFLIILPYIGAIFSLFISLIITYFSRGMDIHLIYIVIIYFIGSSLEAYVLTPRIIGNNIGLNPLWIIFAIFACGALLGFVGILLAIPIAGIIKILLINFTAFYKNSKFYKNN